MSDLEQRKLEAEISHIQAQMAKATAEAAKADTDIKAAQKSLGYWLVEGTKVLGALIIGAGGIMAAITGYQLADIKKEKTELAIEKLKKEVQETSQLLETTTQKKSELDSAV